WIVASGHDSPCWVCRPFASTCETPRIEATDRSKLFEASGIITASATIALIDRLLIIDWKVNAVRKVSPLRAEKTMISTTRRIARFHTEKKCVKPPLNLRAGAADTVIGASP